MTKTDWFPVDIKPSYNGFYEVELTTWPWPTLIKWQKKNNWDIGNPAIIKHWRGLTEKVKC